LTLGAPHQASPLSQKRLRLKLYPYAYAIETVSKEIGSDFGVVNLVDDAIDAGPHPPVPCPLSPHRASGRVPWILEELVQFAADQRLSMVR
jgi:hypothetical protein